MDCPVSIRPHDSRPLSDEDELTTDKSFRLPWLRDEHAPAT
jgi:hypothetical protein